MLIRVSERLDNIGSHLSINSTSSRLFSANSFMLKSPFLFINKYFEIFNSMISYKKRCVKLINSIETIEKFDKEECEMELRQLKAFTTVAKYNSFSKAAMELGYAKSTVSSQIQLLEWSGLCRSIFLHAGDYLIWII